MSSTMKMSPISHKDIEGQCKIQIASGPGFITSMGSNQPARLQAPLPNLQENQVFDICWKEDKKGYVIKLKGQDVGLSYPEHLYPNCVVNIQEPCLFEILSSEGLPGYLIRPMGNMDDCPGAMLALAHQMVFPPMVAIQPAAVGVVTWRFEK